MKGILWQSISQHHLQHVWQQVSKFHGILCTALPKVKFEIIMKIICIINLLFIKTIQFSSYAAKKHSMNIMDILMYVCLCACWILLYCNWILKLNSDAAFFCSVLNTRFLKFTFLCIESSFKLFPKIFVFK